jgi:hypothetical protein
MQPTRRPRQDDGLLALGPNDNSGDVRGIDGGVEEFGASQLRKMHEFVAHFLDFSTDLLARFHSQLDRLPGVPLQNADDGVARLEIDFVLRDQIRTSESKKNGDDK